MNVTLNHLTRLATIFLFHHIFKLRYCACWTVVFKAVHHKKNIENMTKSYNELFLKWSATDDQVTRLIFHLENIFTYLFASTGQQQTSALATYWA